MTDRLKVKEHLRNDALYWPVAESSLSEEWKRRLLSQFAVNKQLKDALGEGNGFLKPLLYVGVPVACILLVFSAYFGFIQPGRWFDKIVLAADIYVPLIGLKEIFVFAALVNGLTFLIRKRGSLL